MLFSEIKFVLEQFSAPYMDFFFSTHELVQNHGQNKNAIEILLKSVALLCDIYYDLNCQDLPEFFEDNMAKFMEKFHFYLTYTNPLAESDVSPRSPKYPITQYLYTFLGPLTSKFSITFLG